MSQDTATSFPEGYIPLELPQGFTHSQSAEDVSEGHSTRHQRSPKPSNESPSLASAPSQESSDRLADIVLIHTNPEDTTGNRQSPATSTTKDPGTSGACLKSQESTPETSQIPVHEPLTDEDAFEDAPPLLPKPSSPPAPLSLSTAAIRQPPGPSEEVRTLSLDQGRHSSTLDIGSGSIRSLRAAARLRVSSNTPNPPAPSASPSRSAYDLWGFRRAAFTTSSDGDASNSPARKL